MLFWVISGKNAFQNFFMLLLVFGGLSIASGAAAQQNKLYAALPWWVSVVFGCGLAAGALASFLGVYWPGKVEHGILLESWSALALAITCFVFPVAVVHEPAARSLPGTATAVITVALLGVASLLRWHQCRRALREVSRFKAALEEIDHES